MKKQGFAPPPVKPRSLERRAGFTLVELIVVVIILGILGTIAIPAFQVTNEKSLSKEAIANLKLISAGEKIFRMENNTYYPSSGSESNVTNIFNNLRVSLSNANWGYTITGGANTFTAVAQRNARPCFYTITESTLNDDPVPTSCP